MKKIGLILAAMMLSASAFASPAGVALYHQGNSSYNQGRFPEAISFYEQALAGGIRNSNLYYNLGNGYYKAGDLGRAALNWRRAERLNPRDSDVRANLELLDKLAREGLVVKEPGRLNEFLPGLRDLGSAKKWGMIFSISIWGFWLCLFLYLLIPAPRAGRIFLGLNVIFIVGMLFFGAGFGFRHHFENEPAGVVMNQGVQAKSGPGEGFPVLFEPPAGSRVLIRECRSGYCQIEIPPGMVGWVEGKVLERI